MNAVMSDLDEYGVLNVVGYRLINAKFPPISLFDDVSDAEDFNDLYAVQALTNPRIQTELGNLSLIARDEIPFGIRGCSYAVASFTHVNPDGSRFSDGSFGIMYIADSEETAVAEVRHHQNVYWSNVEGIHYDRLVFKSLRCTFDVTKGLAALTVPMNDPLYDANNYGVSRTLGSQIKSKTDYSCLKYHSVRNSGGQCFALFSPKEISEVIPARHYEMIWSESAIQSVSVLTDSKY